MKRAALEWGFWHLGRFAADYRAFFGEHPAQTVAGRFALSASPFHDSSSSNGSNGVRKAKKPEAM